MRPKRKVGHLEEYSYLIPRMYLLNYLLTQLYVSREFFIYSVWSQPTGDQLKRLHDVVDAHFYCAEWKMQNPRSWRRICQMCLCLFFVLPHLLRWAKRKDNKHCGPQSNGRSLWVSSPPVLTQTDALKRYFCPVTQQLWHRFALTKFSRPYEAACRSFRHMQQ